MKKELENKLVVALFVVVLITFSFALKDTRKVYPAFTIKDPVKAKLVDLKKASSSELQ